MSDQQKSKGFTLKGAMAFIEGSFGDEGCERLLEALEPELSAILRRRILPSGWYPFRYQVDLYKAIDGLFGSGDLALCWEIGKFTSEYEMTRFHKLFLRMASLDMWIKSASLMWGRYYSAGALQIDHIDESEGAIRIVDFDPLSKAFCYDFGGWLQRTMELSGLDKVDVHHSECVLDGAGACSYVGTYEQRIRTA